MFSVRIPAEGTSTGIRFELLSEHFTPLLFMSFFPRHLIFHWLKFKTRLKKQRDRAIEFAVRKWLVDGRSLAEVLQDVNYTQSSAKQRAIDSIRDNQRIIFFVFRDLHLLDWFTPIHRALTKEFSGRFAVFYINFGSTLKNIGSGFNYLAYARNIEKRLTENQVSSLLHFSDQEIGLFGNFPTPNLIVTSETIRKEAFTAQHRVYLPHYSVPKAGDKLPEKIRFNHVFLPSKPPYSYDEIVKETVRKAVIHKVGYPKINSLVQFETHLFESPNPVVIYAPSLETEIVLAALKQGILEVFKKMTHLNFVIKMHPTLTSKTQNASRYIDRKISLDANIILDSTASIQEIGRISSMLIADFGSVGAEYRLSLGKRIVYLEVPKYLHGGADLRFRDHFADGISNVRNLEATINQVLEKGELSDLEKEEMGNKVLYSYSSADLCAARTIDRILVDDG